MDNKENNTLLLIDLTKNFELIEKNKNFINLNKGQIHLKNCKKIKLKSFTNLRKKTYKILIKRLKKIILGNPENKFFLSEMEKSENLNYYSYRLDQMYLLALNIYSLSYIVCYNFHTF